MAIIGAIICIAIIAEVFLHKGSRQHHCDVCGTDTETRGLFTWSCSNPDHIDNAGEED